MSLAHPTLAQFVTDAQKHLTQFFKDYLSRITVPTLKAAIEHMLLNGGKRLRPLLVYAMGHVFETPLDVLVIPASAVELIHTYSLIHDDLPCMDNADLRRGKPSCHRAYSEGLAVLAGDALHALAFQIIADHPAPTLSAEKRNRMLAVLTKACGPYGMAAGQALDIAMTNPLPPSLAELETIYHLKTGALFSACIELGWLASPHPNPKHQQTLKQFSHAIGLAFQIQDDILDEEATTDILGKPQGIDHRNQKITYPQLVGLANAKKKVQALYEEACTAIQDLPGQTLFLQQLMNQLLARQN